MKLVGRLEQWRRIPLPAGRHRYEASSLGRVRREDTHRLIKDVRSGASYRAVSLGQAHRYYVHEVVLSTFCGPRPAGFWARHLDGNPRNNALGNLRWDSPSVNQLDKRQHGTMLRELRIYGAKLSDAQIREIRVLEIPRWGSRAQKGAVPALAKRYGVSPRHFRKIRSGERRGTCG